MTTDTENHNPSSEDAHGPNRLDSRVATASLPILFPLQTVSLEQSQTSPLELVFVIALAVVGGLLTYQAIRGYRRNDDRSMALFAVGLCLLTVVHAGLKLALEFLVPVVVGNSHSIALSFAATSQFVDIIGLVAIFYAILR